MTVFFLAVLALAFLAVFLPAALRAHRSTPLWAAEGFKRRMNLIAPRSSGSGRVVLVPGKGARSLQRARRQALAVRRRILVWLGAAALVSALPALIGGEGLWEIHLGLDVLLALYIVLLLEEKRRREERSTKVRPIAARSRRRQVSREHPAQPIEAYGSRRA